MKSLLISPQRAQERRGSRGLDGGISWLLNDQFLLSVLASLRECRWRKHFTIWSAFIGAFLAGVWPLRAGGKRFPWRKSWRKCRSNMRFIRILKPNFVQESLIKSLGKKQLAEGMVYFKKPGKMRWIYRKPTKQEIISDGKTLWTYRPEDKQVVDRQDDPGLSVQGALDLPGRDRQSEKGFSGPVCQRAFSRNRLFPGADPPGEPRGVWKNFFLLVDRETFKILQAKIQDAMGNITQISFSKIQFDNHLPDSLFTFHPSQRGRGIHTCRGLLRPAEPGNDPLVSPPAKTVRMISLGCPKNLVDSEVMLGLLREKGWVPSPEGRGRRGHHQYLQLYPGGPRRVHRNDPHHGGGQGKGEMPTPGGHRMPAAALRAGVGRRNFPRSISFWGRANFTGLPTFWKNRLQGELRQKDFISRAHLPV